MSEIKENPKAKYVKFLFCATLLILIPGEQGLERYQPYQAPHIKPPISGPPYQAPYHIKPPISGPPYQAPYHIKPPISGPPYQTPYHIKPPISSPPRNNISGPNLPYQAPDILSSIRLHDTPYQAPTNHIKPLILYRQYDFMTHHIRPRPTISSP